MKPRNPFVLRTDMVKLFHRLEEEEAFVIIVKHPEDNNDTTFKVFGDNEVVLQSVIMAMKKDYRMAQLLITAVHEFANE